MRTHIEPSAKPSDVAAGPAPSARRTSNTNLTALRALEVLEILGKAPAAQSAADVAAALAIERSTAYRMLTTLMAAGYVRRSGRRYRLGYRVLSLAQALLAGDERGASIQAALQRLSALTRETVHYSVLDGDAAVLLYRAKGSQLVTVDFQIGDRAPLHCTSIGKVLLAYGDARLVDDVIRAGLPRTAPKTITDTDAFRLELERVRANGYAFDDLEFTEDMRCVAVPVFEPGGGVAGGISLSGPSSRYTDAKLAELRDAALAVAADLARDLGFATAGTPARSHVPR